MEKCIILEEDFTYDKQLEIIKKIFLDNDKKIIQAYMEWINDCLSMELTIDIFEHFMITKYLVKLEKIIEYNKKHHLNNNIFI